MSDAGRDPVWTDLDDLLKRIGERPAQESEEAVETVAENCVLADRSAGEESEAGSVLPFEDLLEELLGTWSDDGSGGEESAPGSEEIEVPLSALMARLLEDPSPEDPEECGDTAAAQLRGGADPASDSLLALGEGLLGASQAGSEEPAQSACVEASEDTPAGSVTDPETEEQGEQAAPGPEPVGQPGWSSNLLETLIREARDEETVEREGAPAPDGEPALCPEPEPEIGLQSWPSSAQDVRMESHLEIAPLPLPRWTQDLYESLLRGEEVMEVGPATARLEDKGGDPVVQAEVEGEVVEVTPLAALPAEDLSVPVAEEAALTTGWDLLSSLPAPAPPSFSETMLFEPPLPPDSVFDWPVVEHRLSLAQPGAEGVTFEEAESESEVESDDSLRRLVGQMLAEMAASAMPQDQTPSPDAGAARATERFLSFSLAGEVYAVALAGILETDRLPRVTRVPGLPAWAIGVSNLRGAIIPVVDLRRLLSLEEAENPQDGRILVVRPSPGDPPAALVVDRLEGVALLAPGELHPAQQWLDSKVLPYLEGIGSFKGRLVNVLDLGRLFGATGVSGEDGARSGEFIPA